MGHRRPTTPPILSPEETFSSYKSPLCERYLGKNPGGATAEARSKYHYPDSVDISTSNDPIEDPLKGGDPVRRNLTLANGIRKLIWFQL